ncbi:UNVERIFIED_CONTAM: hypothetical protein Sangu_1008700 [Sesamum angustifolium]|uniref:TLC domain-containing protein n=1 Tax=Sesamum angustifolium TaxID=2727405 RepID=A0AAW2PDP0_9LAMI
MLSSEGIYTLIKSYQSQADLLLKNYVSAESFVIDTSIIIGIFACKTVYDLSRLMSAGYFKSYLNLTKSQQIEWSNRAISTFHAVYIATMSLYLLFWSDLYSDDLLRGPITLRSSKLSVFALGVSVGYFLSDFGMIIWCYPSLGGMEYVIHHILSLVGVVYTMVTGEGQLYTYMVLVSEATTPWINLRCWNEEVQSIYCKWSSNIHSMAGRENSVVHVFVLSCVPAFRSGEANAHNWNYLGAASSRAAFCHEFAVVSENIQGIAEDVGQEGVSVYSDNF